MLYVAVTYSFSSLFTCFGPQMLAELVLYDKNRNYGVTE